MTTLKKIRLSEATNHALDWLVSKCKSESHARACLWHKTTPNGERDAYAYSSSWEAVGELIEEDQINILAPSDGVPFDWEAFNGRNLGYWHKGRTPQEAACRAYIHVRMGDRVEVPEELCQVE